jgi:ankyrin repeat protein
VAVRFPIQEAIEAQSYRGTLSHRPEILQLLLRHGADPDARWCPFESRGGYELYKQDHVLPCMSSSGVTPLIAAAIFDEADSVYILLDAHADVRLESPLGWWTALDLAGSQAVLQLLVTAMFPDSATRGADALKFLSEHRPTPAFPGFWDETPPAHAIGGNGASLQSFARPPSPPSPLSLPLPPPPSPGTVRPRSSWSAERVRFLLRLGAKPNQRLTWGAVDWTPLSLALSERDADVVGVLLDNGADPNARWCSSLLDLKPDGWKADPACTRENGMTPLMLAASLGDVPDIELLVKHGADPTLKDWNGRTAQDYARTRNNQNIVRMFDGLP